MLYDFLLTNQKKILQMTEEKSLELAGLRPSSEQLREGLPIFYDQLLSVLKLLRSEGLLPVENKPRMQAAATHSDEEAMVGASEHPEEIELAETAGKHGLELLRLGYTLSHVVHAYGAMCQSITELAMDENIEISPTDFHALNRCLDTAIAGAVTVFQVAENKNVKDREVEHLGFLAHELRNALTSVNLSLQLIKSGTVGFGGTTGTVLDKAMKRIGTLIDRSLTEVRLSIDPKVFAESRSLLLVVDQILVTAQVEANSRDQRFFLKIPHDIQIYADQQLFYSALSNLIQNALKYTRIGGKIEIRGRQENGKVIIEIEDECGGLPNDGKELFKAFEQQNENRTGLGLGLTIAERAIKLNNGLIDVVNLPDHGCVFRITMNSSPAQQTH